MLVEPRPYTDEEIERKEVWAANHLATHSKDCMCLSVDDTYRWLDTIAVLRKRLQKEREARHSSCEWNEVHGRVFERYDECGTCGMTRVEYERVLNPPEFATKE